MAALAASGNVPLSACGAGCDVSRPFWATDWLPWDSLATSAVEPSASGAGCDVSPLRAIDWLPCGSFATGAIDLSGSGAGCDVSRPLWAIDWLPRDSLATSAVEPSACGAGCDFSPLRAIDWLPCGSFATGAIDLSGSGAGCHVSRPFWAIDWLPWNSLATSSVEPSACGAGCDVSRPLCAADRLASFATSAVEPSASGAGVSPLRAIDWLLWDPLATVGGSCACWVIFADGSGDISRRCCSGAITRSCGFCLITIAAPASESTMLSATASDRLACASAGGTTFARLDEALGDRAGGRCWRTGEGGAVAGPRSRGAAGAFCASEDGTDFKLVGWPSCAGLGDAPASIRS